MKNTEKTMDQIVALCKGRGFVYPDVYKRQALSAVVGAFTNTALVMGLIALLFRDAYAAAQGIPAEAVLGFILGIVAANGVPEAIVAAILVPAVCIPMGKALKLNRAPLAAREPV